MKICISSIATVSLLLPFSVNSALIERLGGQAYYDNVAKLTWLADANLYGGALNWIDANAWASNLNVSGVTGWRLPDTIQPDPNCSQQNGGAIINTGFNCVASELGNLYYTELGNTAGTLSNTGPFSNIQLNRYWTATEQALFTPQAWAFDMNGGNQNSYSKTINYYAWAVQSGDIATVPVPASVWLFASGLLGFFSLSKRKKT